MKPSFKVALLGSIICLATHTAFAFDDEQYTARDIHKLLWFGFGFVEDSLFNGQRSC